MMNNQIGQEEQELLTMAYQIKNYFKTSNSVYVYISFKLGGVASLEPFPGYTYRLDMLVLSRIMRYFDIEIDDDKLIIELATHLKFIKNDFSNPQSRELSE